MDSVSNLLLCPCKVGPLILLNLIHQGVVLVHPLGGVGDPHLVALEYLCRAALATTCPAAVSLAIPQLIGGDLRMTLTWLTAGCGALPCSGRGPL